MNTTADLKLDVTKYEHFQNSRIKTDPWSAFQKSFWSQLASHYYCQAISVKFCAGKQNVTIEVT